VELIHDDHIGGGVRALTQRLVREDLGGAADDGGIRVDTGITGHQTDVLGAERLDQLEELLADQGLDRRGVPTALPLGQRDRVRGERDQRLAGAGRCREHEVLAEHQLEHRLLLSRIEPDALLAHPFVEGADEVVGIERLGVGGPCR